MINEFEIIISVSLSELVIFTAKTSVNLLSMYLYLGNGFICFYYQSLLLHLMILYCTYKMYTETCAENILGIL